jgi:hypothetical protein
LTYTICRSASTAKQVEEFVADDPDLHAQVRQVKDRFTKIQGTRVEVCIEMPQDSGKGGAQSALNCLLSQGS